MNSTESPLFDIARRLSSQVFGEVIEDHLIAEVAKAAHDKLRESAILNDMFAGTKAKLILFIVESIESISLSEAAKLAEILIEQNNGGVSG